MFLRSFLRCLRTILGYHRDACIGAFVAAIVGIIGLVALIKWNAPITEQKVAIGATAILCVGAVAAFVVACVQQRRIKRTRTRSAYSRLVTTIETRFQVAATSSPASAWQRWFARKPNDGQMGKLKDMA